MRKDRILLFLALFSSAVVAQRGGGNNEDSEDSVDDAPGRGNDAAPTPPRPTVTPDRPTATPTTPGTKDTAPTPTPDRNNNDDDDEDEKKEEDDNNKKEDEVVATITGGEKANPIVAPTLSIDATISGGSAAAPMTLPTMAPDILLYPAPSVPPTKDAPFMQQSSYPEGTVFICVGAILGFGAAAVIVWRAVIAYMLHRNVKKANSGPLLSDSKGGSGGFYNAPAGSTLSLNPINARKQSTQLRPGTANRNITPNASLFFSPTANVNNSSQADISRRSAYLPAGYYPSVPANPSQTHFPSHSISSSHYGRPGLGPSPPASPLMQPTGSAQSSSRGGTASMYNNLNVSASHHSLTVPPTGRAPSAYLEDLFEDHTAGKK